MFNYYRCNQKIKKNGITIIVSKIIRAKIKREVFK